MILCRVNIANFTYYYSFIIVSYLWDKELQYTNALFKQLLLLPMYKYTLQLILDDLFTEVPPFYLKKWIDVKYFFVSIFTTQKIEIYIIIFYLANCLAGLWLGSFDSNWGFFSKRHVQDQSLFLLYGPWRILDDCKKTWGRIFLEFILELDHSDCILDLVSE